MASPETEARGFRLLDLPPELRNNIYQRIVYRFKSKSQQERRTRHIRGVFKQLPRQIILFLLTCKTVWRELLTLLFGSYLWVADLRFQNLNTSTICILPKESWLLQPSTWNKPTSGNIRHVAFRFEHRTSSQRIGSRDTWTDLQRIARRDRHIFFTVDLQLTKTAPYFKSVVKANVDKTGDIRETLDEAAELLEVSLYESVSRTFERLKQAKEGARDRSMNFSIEEWNEVVEGLKTEFLEWFEAGLWISR